MEDNYERLSRGDFIERTRIELNLTQEEVCKRAQISSATYTSIIKERNTVPYARTLHKIENALDLDYGTLINYYKNY